MKTGNVLYFFCYTSKPLPFCYTIRLFVTIMPFMKACDFFKKNYSNMDLDDESIGFVVV